jgi:AcrR family transcriptional regulator
MPYRPTERTEARRVQSRARIVRAAHELIARGGYRDASVSAVARRAGVATGSVYRHFPSKAELFAEVFRNASQREVDAVAAAAASAPAAPTAAASAPAAPAPAAAVSAPAAPAATAPARIAAAVHTFAERALRGRRLAWALLAEPVDPAVEAERLVFRAAYRDVFAAILCDGVAAGELPDQDCQVSASAVVGAIGEALVGPTSPTADQTATTNATARSLVDELTAFCLRAVGATHASH